MTIRPLTAADQEFLWEAFHIALWKPESPFRQPRAWLDKPHIARYVENWGREGDLGLVALENETPIGAVWARLFPEADNVMAWQDAQTPVLGIGVVEAWQGRGVGSQLMAALIEAATGRFPAISLSHHPQNPAARLYEKFGFAEIGMENGFVLRRRELNQQP